MKQKSPEHKTMDRSGLSRSSRILGDALRTVLLTDSQGFSPEQPWRNRRHKSKAKNKKRK